MTRPGDDPPDHPRSTSSALVAGSVGRGSALSGLYADSSGSETASSGLFADGDRPVVAVYGATGAVGRATVAQLAATAATGRNDGPRLRLGGRSAERLAAVPAPDGTERLATTDLDRFCRGARLVVNCAGPSSELGDAVLRAAVAGGADYVDPGGEALRPLVPPQRRIVLGAGLAPGLTGLLPRYLAGDRRVRAIRGWCGGLDRFTRAAAVDMLASVTGEYGAALAAIRGGVMVPRALEPRVDVELPGFPDRVTAYPFLPVEAQRLAAQLDVAELEWFNVFAGPRVLAAMSRQCRPEELVAAAGADLAGREPYQLLVVEVEYADGPDSRMLVLRGDDGYRLTAAVVTTAVHRVLGGAVRPGVHLAAEVLDAATVLDRLRGHAVVTVADGPALAEEGAL